MVTLNETLLKRRDGQADALWNVALRDPAGTMVRRSDRPAMSPTIFVPVRRGELLTHQDVVARRV